MNEQRWVEIPRHVISAAVSLASTNDKNYWGKTKELSNKSTCTSYGISYCNYYWFPEISGIYFEVSWLRVEQVNLAKQLTNDNKKEN